MTDATELKSRHIWLDNAGDEPFPVSIRNTASPWQVAMIATILLGLVATFAWTAFLGWCVIYMLA